MELHFHKYQGTGNDFVLVDGKTLPRDYALSEEAIRFICDRHFGVGADGLIILAGKEGYDFLMDYYNSDGRRSSMCGNGGRCIAAFAHALGRVGNRCRFLAYDGPHEAVIDGPAERVELQMGNVDQVRVGEDYFFLDTGSPHHVQFRDSLEGLNVIEEGAAIRYSASYRPSGTNVNFVEKIPGGIRMATYERGVEGETLSCGTGVTAAALAHVLSEPGFSARSVKVRTKGGELEVRFNRAGNRFSDIWLCGPAKKVFEGRIRV